MKSKIVTLIAAAALSCTASLPALGAGPKGVDRASSPDPITGIRVAEGYKATIFGDKFGFARHLAVADSGWVYTALFRPQDGKGAAALYDGDGDGIADKVEYFAEDLRGTGIAVHGGYVYYGANDKVLRWPLPAEGGAPAGAGELVIGGFVPQRAHAAKPLVFDQQDRLYVGVGVPSNNCMEKLRTKGSPGQDPCPELELHGGVWRFDLDRMGQDFASDGHQYSTGHRNAMALAWHKGADSLYLAQHGRDQLSQFFPEYYSDADNAELPSEEFHRVKEGDNFGWPFSYYDHRIGARMVSPEYGGDGKTVSEIGKSPLIGFPGHWAPNSMLAVGQGDLAGGVMIAFHGSWNRAPEPQQGYRVVYIPLNAAGEVVGNWVTFADGFPGVDQVISPRDAKFRPTGLAQGPDGAIYISASGNADHAGRIWRITPSE